MKWDGKFDQLLEFQKENGRLHMPQQSKKKTIQALGQWAADQRRYYKIGQLREDRQDNLEEVGFPWNQSGKKEAQWLGQVQKLKQVLEDQEALWIEGNVYVHQF